MTSLETVKRYLRINGSGEDTLLTSLSLAAKQYLLNAGVKPPIPPTDLPFATVEFGEGEHGVVTVTAPEPGMAGDEYSVEVVPGEGELCIAVEDKTLTVTLAGEGSTAIDIAAAITEAGFEATASGEGSGLVTEVVEATYFSGGATVEEAAYLQELELYDLAVTLYVNMLYNGADDKSLEAAMTSIILQIKD
jgi:hypothetical protein